MHKQGCERARGAQAAGRPLTRQLLEAVGLWAALLQVRLARSLKEDKPPSWCISPRHRLHRDMGGTQRDSCQPRGGSPEGPGVCATRGWGFSTPRFPPKALPEGQAPTQCGLPPLHLSQPRGAGAVPPSAKILLLTISQPYQRLPKDFLVARRGQRAPAIVLDKGEMKAGTGGREGGCRPSPWPCNGWDRAPTCPAPGPAQCIPAGVCRLTSGAGMWPPADAARRRGTAREREEGLCQSCSLSHGPEPAGCRDQDTPNSPGLSCPSPPSPLSPSPPRPCGC